MSVPRLQNPLGGIAKGLVATMSGNFGDLQPWVAMKNHQLGRLYAAT